VDAGIDQEVCGLEASFTPDFVIACNNGTTPTELWTKAAGPGTVSWTGNDVVVSVCGTYTFTYSVDNGPCTPQTDDVVVKFFDTPTNVNAGIDQELCGLSAILAPSETISCENGGTPSKTWALTAGPIAATATFTLTTGVQVSQCGIYTFTYTVDNGPCDPVSDALVIKFYDTPVLTTPTPFAVCGYTTPFVVSATADCVFGTVTETVTTKAKPVGAGDPVINFTGLGILVKAPSNTIVVDKCGIYTFTYTVDNGPCTETEDFVVTFYEQPDFDIIGTSTPTLCKEYTYSRDDLRLCNFGAVTYTWTITGGYIDDGTPVTTVATIDGETITVVWNNDLGGTLSVESESIEGLCTSTDTFTVTPSYPLVAGQVKYWNSEETPMPTPFPTYENASYPHDYFYVTLYNGVTAIDTIIVEPRLDEDLFELMSYFEVDLGATYTSTQSIFDVFGCEGYHLAIWDGGLTYHPATYEAVLGANYTYNNWGGVNATDALAIQLMATNVNIQGAPYNFTWVGPNTETPKFGYYSNPTANVNGSTTGSGITALDALTTNYRAVGLLDVFPYTGPGGGSGKFSPNFSVAGRMVPSLPYTTWTAPFDLDNVADVEFTKPYSNYLYYSLATTHKYISEPLSLLNTSYINIYYLAKGDVNSSYIPTSAGFKAAPAMNLEYTDEMIVNKGQVVNVPIRVDRMVQPGAITINLTYNTDLIEVMSVNYNTENYMIDAENGIVRIGWFSEIPANFVAGDAIAMIQVRVIGDIEAGTRYFELADGTDIADNNAQSLKDVKLQTNAINSVDAGLFVTNYPNPFNGNTTISYNLPSASKVVLVVFNTMGEEVETLVSTYQEAGTHLVEFGRTDLKAGVYYYRIIVESEGNTVVKTNSMIRMQ
ncbi:MAG: T9SS type A sorting domain-containing protein, partial [Bacteroidales bacterium]